MKIKEITLKNYGKYKNPNAPITFDKGINVIYGENEAGKSTLFNGLLTLLYGFKPATKENHPYLGWGENQLEIRGVFEDGERDYAVERKLMSGITGRITLGEAEEKIQNRPLPFVADISKQTFESIYALTLEEMVQMSETPWAEIEDQLIINYGMDDIKAPREVIKELDEEMKKLFNPRGQAKNTQVKMLEKELKLLKTMRTTIIGNQQEVLEKEETLKVLDQQIASLISDEKSLEGKAQWWRIHQAIVELTSQLDSIKRQSEVLEEELGTVPNHLLNHESIETNYLALKKKLEGLNYKKEVNDKEIQPLTEVEHKMLGNTNEIQQLIKQLRQLRQEQALNIQQEQFVDEKRQQLERHLSDVMNPLTEEGIVKVSHLNGMVLEGKVETMTRLQKENNTLEKELYTLTLQSVRQSKPMVIAIISVLFGIAAFAAGIIMEVDILKYGAVIAISFGLFNWFGPNKQKRSKDKEAFESKIQFNEHKINELLLSIQKEADFLEVTKESVVENGQRLLTLLQTAKDLAQQYIRIRRVQIEKRERNHRGMEVVEIQAKSYGLKNMVDEAWEALLENAMKKKRHNESVLIESNRLEEEIVTLSQTCAEEKRSLGELEAYLKEVGDGDMTATVDKVKKYYRFQERLGFLKEQLSLKDPSGDMVREIDERHQESIDHGSQESIGIELREVRERLEALKLKRRTIETDLEHLVRDTDIFDVESQLLEKNEQLENIKETYDELMVLRTVLAAYDKDYRETHQPNIHRRTGLYFNQITKGKYPKIYNDEALGKTTLLIRHDGEDKVADDVLSRGTKDQLYLALRLALVDELDKNKTKRPIFLDEVFVNWDMERLEEGLELLQTLSNERQIILFTCHEWMLEKLRQYGNPNVVVL